MTKYIIILFLLLVSAAAGQNTIWIDTVQSGPWQSVQFSVEIDNTQPFVAFQFDVKLPDVLTYTTGSAQLTTRGNGHQLAVTLLDQSTLRIICYSLTLSPFLENNGTVLTFNAVANAKPGTFSLSFVNPVLGDSSENNILTGSRSGQYILLAPDIKLDVDSLNFGSVPLMQSSVRTIVITNEGNQPLSISGIHSTHPEIYFMDSNLTVIGAGEAIQREVRFQPIVKGVKSGILQITSNDPDDTLQIIHTFAHAYAVNEVRVGSAFARSGYTVQLRIRINNMEPFVAFEVTLALPSVMKFVPGSQQLTTRKVDHIISTDTIAGNKLRVIAFSPTNSIFSDSDGDIAELTFEVEGTGGFYSIPVSGVLIGDSAGINTVSASYGGTLEIAAPRIQLESNTINFGNVSIFDTALATVQISNIGSDTLKINYITGGDSTFYVETSYPFSLFPSESFQLRLRFQNEIKGNYSKRLTILHNDVVANPSYIDLTATAFIPNRLQVISTSGEQNSVIPLSFGVTNNEQFVGFQFDVALPQMIVFQPGTVELSTRGQGHSVLASILPNGDMRILAFSLTQAPFLGDSGEVVRFDVNLTADTGTYPIELKNVIIGNSANQNIVSGCDSGTINVFVKTLVDDNNGLPKAHALYQNYPNPFNPRTYVRYAICDVIHVSLEVYDISGKKVATLVDEIKQPGEYIATWDAMSITSGVYYYRLIAGQFMETKKLILIR
jgi:hypothetical protein